MGVDVTVLALLSIVVCGSGLLVRSTVCDLLVRCKLVVRVRRDDGVESVKRVAEVVESAPGV